MSSCRPPSFSSRRPAVSPASPERADSYRRAAGAPAVVARNFPSRPTRSSNDSASGRPRPDAGLIEHDRGKRTGVIFGTRAGRSCSSTPPAMPLVMSGRLIRAPPCLPPNVGMVWTDDPRIFRAGRCSDGAMAVNVIAISPVSRWTVVQKQRRTPRRGVNCDGGRRFVWHADCFWAEHVFNAAWARRLTFLWNWGKIMERRWGRPDDPSPSEIAAATARIRMDWSEHEFRVRAGFSEHHPWEAPSSRIERFWRFLDGRTDGG
jgi:hypothetical protein